MGLILGLFLFPIKIFVFVVEVVLGMIIGSAKDQSKKGKYRR